MTELVVIDRVITSLTEVSEAARMRGPRRTHLHPGLRGGVLAERPPVRLEGTHQ